MDPSEKLPSWLKKDDHAEQAWAKSYLLERLPLNPADMFQSRAIRTLPIEEIIAQLDSNAEGVKLLNRLRNSIRQRRYRLKEGGRKTCSFTLPKETKSKLKKLATKFRLSETAVLERLIEDADQHASAQKKQEALQKVINRNENKLAQELSKIRLDATTRQLEACLEHLAAWQTLLKGSEPELSDNEKTEASTIAKKRMNEIQEAIAAAVAKHEMMSPRSIGTNA